MKIGILREGKTPPDKRVPFTPRQCVELQQKFPGIELLVQPSAVRCYTDQDYLDVGIRVQEDLQNCEILLGVKEVRIQDLLESKMYFFFSHTIKKQPYNRKLLQSVLKKNIQLVDYETLTDSRGFRIIGFGRFAGLVGAYNGFRALGMREDLFMLKPAHRCEDLKEMLAELDQITLPPIKIAFTGDGRVANGVLEVLEHMNIMRLSSEEYLNTDTPGKAVYCQLLPQDYVEHQDGNTFQLSHFFSSPEEYQNTFLPFARQTDLFIASAYWDPQSPVLFTPDDMRREDFRISVISDITCDIEGSVPSTKRASTIEDPFYDYDPQSGEIKQAFSGSKQVTVQAVDNLPCELPKDASEDFGRNLIDKVLPALLNTDPDAIIERAMITKEGELTANYSYLNDYVNE